MGVTAVKIGKRSPSNQTMMTVMLMRKRSLRMEPTRRRREMRLLL